MTDRDLFLGLVGEFRAQADRCIRCGFCNAVCPTSNILSSFKESRKSRGRLIMLQSISEGKGGLDPFSKGFYDLIDLCYNCHRCVPVCPAGIPIPDVMASSRSAFLKARGKEAVGRGRRLLADYERLERLGSLLAPISNWAMRSVLIRKVVENAFGIDARAPLPQFRRRTLTKSYGIGSDDSKKAVYFHDVFAKYNAPDFGRLVIRTLERAGCQVIIPPQRDSGMPKMDYGLFDELLRDARFNVKSLYPYAAISLPIVCSSPAAALMLKQKYPRLVDSEEARVVSGATKGLGEFLIELVNAGSLRINSGSTFEDIVYHTSCLSKAVSPHAPYRELLVRAGYQVHTLEGCCGMAGTWGMLHKNYDLADEVGRSLFSSLEGHEKVVTESETCRLQIEAHSGIQVFFPLEVLERHLSR